MSSNMALRRREILDYADTIRLLSEQGVDPAIISEAKMDLQRMRQRFNDDLTAGRLK